MSVLVTDGNSRATLAVVRALGRAGIPVTVGEDTPTSLAGRSRFSTGTVCYPSPWTDPEAFQAFLREEVRKKRYELLLPMSDVTVWLVAQAQESLRPSVRLTLTDIEQVRRAQDKRYVLELARHLGIACPVTHSVGQECSLYDVAQTIRYPVVIKPRFSRYYAEGGWARGTVQYAHDPDDLVRKYQRMHGQIPEPMIQERIDGEGMGVFLLLWNGQLKGAFCHRRLCEKPPSGGVSVLCQSIPLDRSLVAKSVELLQQLGWQGPAMVEFKTDRRTGQACLMEVNGRFWGSLQLAIDAGINFPVLLYRLAIGENPQLQSDYKVGLKSRWLLGYLDHLVMRIVANGSTDRSVENHESKFQACLNFLKFYEPNSRDAIFRLDDPKPFLFECRRYAGGKLHRFAKHPEVEIHEASEVARLSLVRKPAKTALDQRSGA